MYTNGHATTRDLNGHSASMNGNGHAQSPSPALVSQHVYPSAQQQQQQQQPSAQPESFSVSNFPSNGHSIFPSASMHLPPSSHPRPSSPASMTSSMHASSLNNSRTPNQLQHSHSSSDILEQRRKGTQKNFNQPDKKLGESPRNLTTPENQANELVSIVLLANFYFYYFRLFYCIRSGIELHVWDCHYLLYFPNCFYFWQRSQRQCKDQCRQLIHELDELKKENRSLKDYIHSLEIEYNDLVVRGGGGGGSGGYDSTPSRHTSAYNDEPRIVGQTHTTSVVTHPYDSGHAAAAAAEAEAAALSSAQVQSSSRTLSILKAID
jgi:hypothetical protein